MHTLALCAEEKVSGFGPTFFEKKVAKKLLIAWFEQIINPRVILEEATRPKDLARSID